MGRLRRHVLAESSLLKYIVATTLTKQKRKWVHNINIDRPVFGEFYHLFVKLTAHPEKFREYFRMTIDTFNYIENKIMPVVEKIATNWRKPISVKERLAITLRFLATGTSYRSLEFTFRLGVSTVAGIVQNVCLAIWQAFVTEHMPQPTQQMLLNSAEEYWNKWNMPHRVGAIDGKHISMKCPSHSGSMYYNYKQFFSIVLQAVADANCKFLAIEVGAYGKQSDGGIFNSSQTYSLLKTNSFNLHEPKLLPDSDIQFPFYIVGDEAYPLTDYLMRPYPRRQLTQEHENFNYRLSRARRCVECVFGILVAKWRILTKSIETTPSSAENIVKCVCLLHNIIIDRERSKNDRINSDAASTSIHNNSTLGRTNNRASRSAYALRDVLKTYLNDNPL